jgi:hypothetical protein
MRCPIGTSKIPEFFDIRRGAQLASFLPLHDAAAYLTLPNGGNDAIAFSVERQHVLHRHLRSLTAKFLSSRAQDFSDWALSITADRARYYAKLQSKQISLYTCSLIVCRVTNERAA